VDHVKNSLSKREQRPDRMWAAFIVTIRQGIIFSKYISQAIPYAHAGGTLKRRHPYLLITQS
jgi:hypothetical protein